VLQTTNAASSEASAAKVEVGRKSPAARRAGSIPASGTTIQRRAAISGCAAFLRSAREANLRTTTPNKRRQLKKQRQAEELHRRADELEQKEQEFEKDREIEFYAAALDGYYTTSLEYDKGIFTLAAGGLGLLVTLLTTSSLKTSCELAGYLGGISAFSVDLLLLLWIFRLNKDHIIHVVQGQEQLSTKKLKRFDFAVMCVFFIGVVCAAFVGVSAAVDSYDKVKEEADNKPAHPATPTVRSDSVNSSASSSVPALSLQETQSAVPVATSSRPASSTPVAPASRPASNPTDKGK